jgi:hypothetical protein
MKLSELNPADVTPVETPESTGKLKLSDLHPDEVTAAPEPGGFLAKAKELASDFLTGHRPYEKNAPIEPSIAQNLGYLGGVASTGLIQGAKALAGKGSMDDMKEAIAGRAKSAPQQLQESGVSPTMSYVAGIPLQIATDPMAEFSAAPFKGALSAGKTAVSPVAEYIGNRVKDGAESFATSPFFEKVANATNVVGKGKSVLEKIAASGELPEALQPAADAASGMAGRALAYKSPLAPVQAISDASRGVTYVQKGMAKVLDKAGPAVKALQSSKIFSDGQLEKIAASPFFQTLKSAHETGGTDAVSTAHYVLQQTDPGYQQLLKDEQH